MVGVSEMNYFLLSSGFLSITVGIVHSILGEFLIFKNLRNGSLVPSVPAEPLKERHIHILWATWHLASVFGFAVGAMLVQLAAVPEYPTFVVHLIAFSMLAGSALVFYATKAKHPGWIGLLGVALLCWLALIQW